MRDGAVHGDEPQNQVLLPAVGGEADLLRLPGAQHDRGAHAAVRSTVSLALVSHALPKGEHSLAPAGQHTHEHQLGARV